MSEEKYFASSEKDEAELARLRLEEKNWDVTTVRHLETIGVAVGWNCLEVGAGAGSIAQWLSTRVGPTGKVVATDIDTRFIRRLNIPNLEIRQHDILKDDLETNRYDLVHCRTVLMHFPEPEKALKRMADAIRQGGWLLIEEADYGMVLTTDVTNPSAALFTSILRSLYDVMRKKNILDPYFGRRVRGLVEELGFEQVAQEGTMYTIRVGEPLAQHDLATFRMGAKPMVAAGLLSQEQYDSVQHLLEDKTFNYPGATLFSAWGRKPV